MRDSSKKLPESARRCPETAPSSRQTALRPENPFAVSIGFTGIPRAEGLITGLFASKNLIPVVIRLRQCVHLTRKSTDPEVNHVPSTNHI